MKKRIKKISKRAIRCVAAMSQGDAPSRAEFLAAWNDGLIDTTFRGDAVIRKEVYGRE